MSVLEQQIYLVKLQKHLAVADELACVSLAIPEVSSAAERAFEFLCAVNFSTR